MATAITLPRGPMTISATIDALEARELDYSGNVPRAILIEFVGSAGGYAFLGTDGDPLNAGLKIPVAADSPYQVDIRSSRARNLSQPSLFVEADAAATRVNITVVA
jgi:hypothetical protein